MKQPTTGSVVQCFENNVVFLAAIILFVTASMLAPFVVWAETETEDHQTQLEEAVETPEIEKPIEVVEGEGEIATEVVQESETTEEDENTETKENTEQAEVAIQSEEAQTEEVQKAGLIETEKTETTNETSEVGEEEQQATEIIQEQTESIEVEESIEEVPESEVIQDDAIPEVATEVIEEKTQTEYATSTEQITSEVLETNATSTQEKVEDKNSNSGEVASEEFSIEAPEEIKNEEAGEQEDVEENNEEVLSAEELAEEQEDAAELDGLQETDDADQFSADLSALLHTDDILDAQKDFTSVVRQSQPYTCGPASLATLLTNVGEETAEEQVLELIEVIDKDRGVTLASLYDASVALGFETTLFSATAELLRTYVTQTGSPVLIHDEKEGVGGHFSVVRSFEDGQVQLADTEAGNIQYSFEDFTKIFNGSILVVNDPQGIEGFEKLSHEEASEIWGMYVPVAEAAGEFQQMRSAIVRLQQCQDHAIHRNGNDIVDQHADRRACYAEFADALNDKLSTAETKAFNRNWANNDNDFNDDELGEHASDLYKQMIRAEARYKAALAAKVGTSAQLNYRKNHLDRSVDLGKDETKRLKQKLGEYEHAIAAETVKLKGLSKKLEQSISRSDKKANYRIERSLKSAQSRLTSYEKSIYKYKKKMGSSTVSSSSRYSSKYDKYMKKAEKYKEQSNKYKKKYREYRKKSKSKAKKYKKKYRKYYDSYKKYKKKARKYKSASRSGSSRGSKYQRYVDKYERYAKSTRRDIEELERKLSQGMGDPVLQKQVKLSELQVKLNEIKAKNTRNELERKERAIADQRDQIKGLERSMASQGQAADEYEAELQELKSERDEAIADFNEEKKFVLKTENAVANQATDDFVSKNNVDALKDVGSTVINTIPGIGEGYDVVVLVGGKDPITGEQLNALTKTVTIVGLASGVGSGKAAREGLDVAIEHIAKKLGTDKETVYKYANEYAEKAYEVRSVREATELVRNLSPTRLYEKIESEVTRRIAKEGAEALSKTKAFKLVTDIDRKVRDAANHALKLDIRSGDFTGGHTLRALEDHPYGYIMNRIGVQNVSDDIPYEAQVSVMNKAGDVLNKAGNNGVSSFFPDSWSKEEIIQNVIHAVKNNEGLAGTKHTNEFVGKSINGKFEIHFYLSPEGYITSFFPKI